MAGELLSPEDTPEALEVRQGQNLAEESRPEAIGASARERRTRCGMPKNPSPVTTSLVQTVPLPPDLRGAIAAKGGGRVVLVIGAGASFEDPTKIPLARDCSETAHRALVDDGVLSEGDCGNPSDLSELAEVVFAKTGGQTELVRRLPRRKFRTAKPNEGTKAAAALLCEGAVSAVLSLNFDLSMQMALAELGAGDEVGLIRGPSDQADIANVNLIYLHRSVEADPEEWVLRSQSLEVSWKGDWEEMMAGRVITAAVTVFAGLGSPASVLIDTTKKIRAASKGNARTFQVDPGPFAGSSFASALEITEADYLKYGWCEFMLALSGRLVLAQVDELLTAAAALAAREGWSNSAPANLRARLGLLGLVGLGELRARWLFDDAAYLPQRALDPELWADLMLAVGMIEDIAGYSAVFDAEGPVDFLGQGQLIASITIASGRGTMRWGALEARLHQQASRRGVAARRPRFALVGGVASPRPANVSPPSDLLRGESSGESILGEDSLPRLVSINELRASPELAKKMIA